MTPSKSASSVVVQPDRYSVRLRLRAIRTLSRWIMYLGLGDHQRIEYGSAFPGRTGISPARTSGPYVSSLRRTSCGSLLGEQIRPRRTAATKNSCVTSPPMAAGTPMPLPRSKSAHGSAVVILEGCMDLVTSLKGSDGIYLGQGSGVLRSVGRAAQPGNDLLPEIPEYRMIEDRPDGELGNQLPACCHDHLCSGKRVAAYSEKVVQVMN